MGSSKLNQFIQHTDWTRSGKLAIPLDKSWIDKFLRELLAFQDASYADQVDALTYVAEHMKRSQSACLDIDVKASKRLGRERPSRPRREDKKRF